MLGATFENTTSDWVVLWSLNADNLHVARFDLNPGFASEWHTYELRAEFEDDSSNVTLVSYLILIISVGKSSLYMLLQQLKNSI